MNRNQTHVNEDIRDTISEGNVCTIKMKTRVHEAMFSYLGQ